MIVTKDLTEFGHVEKEEAGQLLIALKSDRDKTEYLGDGVEVFFNKHSGYVFLSDEDYNTAMLNSDNELEDFLVCSNCGHEALKSEFNEYANDCCRMQYV